MIGAGGLGCPVGADAAHSPGMPHEESAYGTYSSSVTPALANHLSLGGLAARRGEQPPTSQQSAPHQNPSPAWAQAQQESTQHRAAQRARMRRRQQQRNITDQRVTAHRRFDSEPKHHNPQYDPSPVRAQSPPYSIINQRQTRSNHIRQTHRRQQQNGEGHPNHGKISDTARSARDLLQPRF